MTSSPTSNRWFAHMVVSLLVALLLLLAVFGVNFKTTMAQPPVPSVEPIVASTEPYIEYLPNTALIKLRPGVALASGEVNASGAVMNTNAESLNGLLNALGATSTTPVFDATDTVRAARADAGTSTGLDRIYRVQWTSSIPVEHAVAALAADAAVEYAEPDYIARPARTPNDVEYASQWALPKINAPAAWDVSTGDPGVVIAIVDSGVDTTHPDFVGRLWVNDDPPNGVDDDLNGKVDDTNGWNVLAGNATLTDPNGHGSQVGGVAGAATNNGAGVAGMCWGCKLMFVNAMQANNAANYSDIAAAVQYAASNGAHVINLSLGGYADSAVLRDAIREAATTAVIVAGAGNDDSATPFYPAAYPEVLAVAATDADDKKAIFSNYGAWVDVSAPGKDIRTTTLGGYATDSGTSLSTAFVSGLAGLIKSKNPVWTAEQVKWQILNTAANIDALNPTRAGQLGSGRINAGSALATTPQARARVESYAIDGQANARPAPGQAIQLVINVRNLWLPGQSLQGTLASSDPYVSISDNAGVFGDIAPGQLGSNSGDPFGMTVSGSAPYNHALQFTLNLSGAGGYSLAVPFTIQVRSAVETLGNTIYTQNTTWTSDKTYVLAGTVIVNQGVALTIQPGTVIKGNPGKFIRVDGTLVARGTVAQPIVFTTNSITNATWSGLRFADTAVDATYDGNGNYVAGSVLQHVEVSYADVAANLSTRSPYIADSTFKNNGTSIQIGNNNNGGAPYIERNTFSDSVGNMMPGIAGSAILINGGQPLIKQNSFARVTSGIIANTGMSGGGPSILSNSFRDGVSPIYVSGSATIVGNVIQDYTGTAINIPCCGSSTPVIRDNVIVGNGGGIYAAGLQQVDIEHNLIANNGASSCAMPPCGGGNAAAVTLDVQSGGSSQHSPALAYNSTRNEYLAAWIDSTGMGAVKALRLGPDGQPIGGEIVISGQQAMPATGSQIAYQPSQDRYLVVWSGMEGVKGRFVSGSGQVSGDVVSVSPTGDASVAIGRHLPGSDSFLVAYQATTTNPCCSARIYVQRLTATGALNGPPVTVDGEPSGALYLGDVALASTGDRALVVFHSDSWNQRIWGAWIEPSTQTASAVVIAENPDGSARRPAAAFGIGPNRYSVAWERLRGWDEWSTPRALMDQIVNADGSLPISSTVVYSDSGQTTNPRVVFNSTDGNFMMAWVHGPVASTPAQHTLYVRRMDENGTGIGSPVLVSSPASAGAMYGMQMGRPAIAYNSQNNEYLVAWADNRLGMTSNIFAQRLSATGQLLDNTWTPADETNPANNFRISQSRGVRYNTIIHNTGYGIQLGGQSAASVNIANNNLFGNGTYDLYLSGGQAGTQNFTVNATDNFWNIDASQIPNRIRDCTFDDNGCNTASSTVGKVAYNPPLAAPDQTAPAYVRSVTMDPNPVGLQRGTVTIDFSKPMSVTALPAVSFHDSRSGTTQQVFSDTAGVMVKDVFGRLWFGMKTMTGEGIGVRMYDGRQWATYRTTNSGLGNDNIIAIHAAANGDIWFGHEGGMGTASAIMSRLRGSTWTTYTNNMPDGSSISLVMTIGDDRQGAIWLGTMGWVYRFDGSTWRQYTTADGQALSDVLRIVRDGQGRMWFQSMMTQGLSVFDGIKWITYNVANGFPANGIDSLFVDSLGRVWVGLGMGGAVNDPNRPYLAMHDGASWHYYGSAETNGHVSCTVNGAAQAPDGSLWFRVCGNLVSYDGSSWSTATFGNTYNGTIIFDSRNNFWYSDFMGAGTSVRWGGNNFVFVDGRWISPTRFQAGYDFTALVPPGYYVLETDGAIGIDGMSVDTATDDTFRVDFGAGVTFDPPLPPIVTARTSGSLSSISASWQSRSPNIDQYRYAIGTTPGARDVVGWTYVAGTSFERNDLNLVKGRTYYVTVQARNTSGLWSIDSAASSVVIGQSNLYLPSIRR